MSRPAWRRALRGDIADLCAFLREEEPARVGFSGRILVEESKPPRAGEPERTSRLAKVQLPSPLRGAVWIAERERDESRSAEGIAGALLCHPSRLAFPIFPRRPDADPSLALDRELALVSCSFRPASALGLARDVERYEALLGLACRASVSYRLMTRAAGGPRAGEGAAAVPRPMSSPNAPPEAYPGLVVRRARASDLEALLPLQEAYEREEVLTPIHSFNASACRASLARALERQLVYVALEGGVAVGKAATNARGFGCDQIGGVYTLPARRGRGVARALVSAILAELDAAGRGSSLFVKPANAPARSLYGSLGYDELDDYRADYYEA